MLLLGMAQQLLLLRKSVRRNLFQLLRNPRKAAPWRQSRSYDQAGAQRKLFLWKGQPHLLVSMVRSIHSVASEQLAA